jgi:hypothetical protein
MFTGYICFVKPFICAIHFNVHKVLAIATSRTILNRFFTTGIKLKVQCINITGLAALLYTVGWQNMMFIVLLHQKRVHFWVFECNNCQTYSILH